MQNGLDAAFAVLVQDALRRTERVTEGLRELEHRYGGASEERSYRAFVDALLLAAQSIRSVLERHRENFDRRGADKQAWYLAVQRIAEDLGARLEENLRLLRVRRDDELEVFATPMTRLAKQLVPNAELLFFPWAQDRYTYEVYNPSFAQGLSSGLEDDLVTAFGPDIQFIKLRHSTLRQRDVFHHTVFAHEVAHQVLRRNITGERVGEDMTVLSWVLSEAPLPESLKAHTRDMVAWLTELACDYIAVRVTGPAYLVAFSEVTVANRGLTADTEGTTHPPPSLRYKILLREAMAYAQDPRTQCIALPLQRSADARPMLEDHELPAGVEHWVDTALATLGAKLEHLAPADAFYPPSMLHADMPLVCEHSEHRVPACERLTAMEGHPADEWSLPLDWRSIINGVLFWHLTSSHSLGKDEWREVARRRDEAAHLALAGIELSEFHRRAQRLRAELGAMRLPDDWRPA